MDLDKFLKAEKIMRTNKLHYTSVYVHEGREERVREGGEGGESKGGRRE